MTARHADTAQAREWDKPVQSVHTDDWDTPTIPVPPDPTWPARRARALQQLEDFFNDDNRPTVP